LVTGYNRAVYQVDVLLVAVNMFDTVLPSLESMQLYVRLFCIDFTLKLQLKQHLPSRVDRSSGLSEENILVGGLNLARAGDLLPTNVDYTALGHLCRSGQSYPIYSTARCYRTRLSPTT